MKFLGSKKIETERLELRPQTMKEQEYLWSVLMIPEVNKYYLSIPKKFGEKLKSWEKQEEFYIKEMEHANDPDVFKWSIFLKGTDECIGRITCQDGKTEDSSVRDAGWYIDPRYQGNGYCSEAAKAMFDYMFKECEISEIRTGAAVINPASWKIMEKYGFTRENEIVKVEYTFVEEPVDDYQYTITREEYLSKNSDK